MWLITALAPSPAGKYLLEYEDALRALGPKYKCVTVPYWDWAQDTLVCEASPSVCKRFDSLSGILQGEPCHVIATPLLRHATPLTP